MSCASSARVLFSPAGTTIRAPFDGRQPRPLAGVNARTDGITRGVPVTAAQVGVGAGAAWVPVLPGGRESAAPEQAVSASAMTRAGARSPADRATGVVRDLGWVGFDIVQSSLFGAK